jgi:hypothetical protein
VLLEDLPNGGRSHRDAETRQFPGDSPVLRRSRSATW